MSFFSTAEFFSSPELFGGLPVSAAEGSHSSRTLRLPMSSQTISSSAAALVIALAGATVAHQVGVTVPLADLSPVDADSPRSTERVARALALRGRSVTAALEVERWADGTTVARLAGTSLYGEASSLSRAIADLQENLEEFEVTVLAALDGGRMLGGQVLRDWQATGALAAGVRRV